MIMKRVEETSKNEIENCSDTESKRGSDRFLQLAESLLDGSGRTVIYYDCSSEGSLTSSIIGFFNAFISGTYKAPTMIALSVAVPSTIGT